MNWRKETFLSRSQTMVLPFSLLFFPIKMVGHFSFFSFSLSLCVCVCFFFPSLDNDLFSFLISGKLNDVVLGFPSIDDYKVWFIRFIASVRERCLYFWFSFPFFFGFYIIQCFIIPSINVLLDSGSMYETDNFFIFVFLLKGAWTIHFVYLWLINKFRPTSLCLSGMWNVKGLRLN